MKRRAGVFLDEMFIDLFVPLPFAIVPHVEPPAEVTDSVDGAGLPGFGMKGMALVCVLSGVRIALATGDCSACRDVGKSFDRNTLLIEQILNPSCLNPGSAGRVSINVRRDATAGSRRYLSR